MFNPHEHRGYVHDCIFGQRTIESERISMRRLLLYAFLSLIVCQSTIAQQPASVQELWADFDPRQDPLETEIIREWQETTVSFAMSDFSSGRSRASRLE
jgi:hypothetical protein